MPMQIKNIQNIHTAYTKVAQKDGLEDYLNIATLFKKKLSDVVISEGFSMDSNITSEQALRILRKMKEKTVAEGAMSYENCQKTASNSAKVAALSLSGAVVGMGTLSTTTIPWTITIPFVAGACIISAVSAIVSFIQFDDKKHYSQPHDANRTANNRLTTFREDLTNSVNLPDAAEKIAGAVRKLRFSPQFDNVRNKVFNERIERIIQKISKQQPSSMMGELLAKCPC